uniref:L-rhamnose mutarotase n=1 Tax=Faecalibacterium sp. An121 TaxID=1965550 RepID=UPI001FA8C086|nr:L-rhamnose mutarotase [Faecalibacterium sp. An121]
MEGPGQARLQRGIPAAARCDLARNGPGAERGRHLQLQHFYVNGELFGYYECAKGVAYAEKVQAESPVVARWNEYMKDILELEMDPETGAQPKLEQVFRLD